jgi:hypothetical protein
MRPLYREQTRFCTIFHEGIRGNEKRVDNILYSPTIAAYPHWESNPGTRFRKPLLYPLSYGDLPDDILAEAAGG